MRINELSLSAQLTSKKLSTRAMPLIILPDKKGTGFQSLLALVTFAIKKKQSNDIIKWWLCFMV